MWWKQTLWVEATTDCSLETIKMWVWCCERWAEHTGTNKMSRKQHTFVSSVINLEAFLSLPVAHMLAATLGKWQTAFFFSGKMIKFDHISCFNQIDSINQITWLFITPFFFLPHGHHRCVVLLLGQHESSYVMEEDQRVFSFCSSPQRCFPSHIPVAAVKVKLSPKCNLGFICEHTWVKPLCKSKFMTKEALLRLTVFSFFSSNSFSVGVHGALLR